MKKTILILAFMFMASLSLHAGGETFLKATVAGTVQTQILLSMSDGRIHTEVLNNKRIFSEFQVSKDDYELCVTFEANSLVLVPKSASSPLPFITVVNFNSDTNIAVDTKARIAHTVGSADKGTATNLFQDLAGEMAGTLHYTGPVLTPIFTKYNLSFSGHGTDQSGGSAAILKFKVTTSGHFTQAP